MDLVVECRRVVFEWEGFGLESFRNNTTLSYIYTSWLHKALFVYFLHLCIWTKLILILVCEEKKSCWYCVPSQRRGENPSSGSLGGRLPFREKRASPSSGRVLAVLSQLQGEPYIVDFQILERRLLGGGCREIFRTTLNSCVLLFAAPLLIFVWLHCSLLLLIRIFLDLLILPVRFLILLVA